MSIFNKRNALFGWLAWVTTKQAMKHKARKVVPDTASGHKGISAGVAAAIAAAVGGLVFWRRRRGADEADDAGE